jgi:hypothetical protein
MLFEMFLHRRLIDKFLFAFGVWARVRTFSRMRPDVLIKYGFLSEAFSTLWANVRLLPCVNPDMLVEYRLLTKRLTVGITTNFKYVISYFGGRGKFHLFAVGETAAGSVCDNQDNRKVVHPCEFFRVAPTSLFV